MATAHELVAKAASQIGIREEPAGSNKIKYWDYYKQHCGANYQGEPWCGAFVTWAMSEIGAWDFTKDEARFRYCPSLVNWAKQNGQWLDREEKPQPGDIILFGSGNTACHVGIVEARPDSSSVITIEGNTSVTSNDNGGAVMRRSRSYGKVGSSWYIMGFVRPKWEETVKETTKQPESKPMNDVGLYYRSHVQKLGWLEPVHDGMISGTTGNSLRLEGFKIDTRKCKYTTLAIDVVAHIQGIGQKVFKNINHDTVIGTEGQGKRLEGFMLEVSGLPEHIHLYTKAHIQGIGWTEWVTEGNWVGTMGDSTRIEAVRFYIA